MVPPLLVPIGATIGATLFGAGALEKIGARAGIDEAGDPVFDQFPDAIQQDPPTPQPPANGDDPSDTGGIGGILLGLAAFIAVLVFGRTFIQEII